MLGVAGQMMTDYIKLRRPDGADELMALASMIDDIYASDAKKRAEKALKPYSHCAPVSGRPTVFANVEYPEDNPPDAIEIRGNTYLRHKAQGKEGCGSCLWRLG